MKAKAEIKNCWEYMRCGRGPGGHRAHELGICPVVINLEYDGVNGGRNAGRFCWFVTGTFCQGEVQGTYAKKLRNCIECPFYLLVEEEEGRHLVLTPDDIE